MQQIGDRQMAERLIALEKQMAVVARAIELLTRGLHDDAAAEIAKIM